MMKRWRGEHIPYGPFQLGRFRDAINIVAIIYTFFTSFFLLWPVTQEPPVAYMNWSIVLVGGIVVIAVVWWFVEGRKSFIGPNIDRTYDQHVD